MLTVGACFCGIRRIVSKEDPHDLQLERNDTAHSLDFSRQLDDADEIVVQCRSVDVSVDIPINMTHSEQELTSELSSKLSDSTDLH